MVGQLGLPLAASVWRTRVSTSGILFLNTYGTTKYILYKLRGDRDMQQQRSYAAVCIHRRTWQHFFKWTFVSCLTSFISLNAYYFCHQQSIQIKSIVSRRLITLLCRPIDATFLLVNYGWSTTRSSRLCCSFHTSVPQAGHPKCRISIYSLFTLMPLIIVALY